jgi:hypothetical protein
MPLRYQIDDEHRLVLARGYGVLTDQEVFEYKQSVWSLERVAGYDEIVDVTEVDGIDFPSTERLRELARLSAAMDVKVPSRVAILANDLVTFEIARMYEIFRKLDRRSTRDVSVFRNMEEALAWLKAPRRAGPLRRRPSTLGALLVLTLASASCTVSARTRGSDSEATPPAAGAGVAAGIATSAPPEGPLRTEESRVPGMLAEAAEVTPVLAPPTVAVGERFHVTVTTTGSGCDRLGDTGVLMGERDAVIYVYDFTSANRPGVACTMIFKHLKREVPLTFSQPGEAVIRVWGRRSTPDGTPGGEPLLVERRIQVRG